MWWNFFLQSHICCWLCAGICDPALLLSFAPRYFILKRISTKSRSLTLAPRALFEPTQGNTLFVGIYVGRSFSSYLKGIYCFLWFSTWFSFRSFHFASPVCQINFTFIRLCLPSICSHSNDDEMSKWVSEPTMDSTENRETHEIHWAKRKDENHGHISHSHHISGYQDNRMKSIKYASTQQIWAMSNQRISMRRLCWGKR